MPAQVQRSMLIIPTHVRKFVEKACRREADAVLLDLEDGVPPLKKPEARELVASSIPIAGKGGADALVRVNHNESLEEDIRASVHPGLHGLFIPKVESAQDVAKVESIIAPLEQERGIGERSLKLALHIESPRGFLNMREIAASSARIESMSIGADDYCLELGVEPSEEGTELFLIFATMVNVCKEARVEPMGVLGSVADFTDLEAFRRVAERGRQLGATGAFCIHPGQVKVLNSVFSPDRERVEHAKRVVAAFEKGLEEGRAAVSLDGRMVDTPIFKRAKALLDKAEAIDRREAKKAAALKTLGKQE